MASWGESKETSPEARMIHAIYPQYPGYQAGNLIMTGITYVPSKEGYQGSYDE